MRTYASSRVKRKSFYRKSELQMFLLISDDQAVHQYGVSIQCHRYWKLYKGVWNVSTNNSKTVGHKDLRSGQIVYILVFCNISFSWLLTVDGFRFIFLCRVYCVMVKTKNRVWKGGSWSRITAPFSRESRIPQVFHQFPEYRFSFSEKYIKKSNFYKS